MTDLPDFANLRDEPLDLEEGDPMIGWVLIGAIVFWGLVLAALLISFDPLGIVR